MSELIIPEWLDQIGMAAAFLAFIIAVYLQLYVEEKIKVRYVIGFVGLGFALFFLSFRSAFLNNSDMIFLRAFGYTILIILELVGCYSVMNEVRIRTP